MTLLTQETAREKAREIASAYCPNYPCNCPPETPCEIVVKFAAALLAAQAKALEMAAVLARSFRTPAFRDTLEQSIDSDVLGVISLMRAERKSLAEAIRALKEKPNG